MTAYIKDAENFSLEGGKIKIVANKRDGFDSDNDKKLEVRVDISQAKIGGIISHRNHILK